MKRMDSKTWMMMSESIVVNGEVVQSFHKYNLKEVSVRQHQWLYVQANFIAFSLSPSLSLPLSPSLSVSLSLSLPQMGTRVGIMRVPEFNGSLLIFIDGAPIGIIATGIPEKVYGFVELQGDCEKVCLSPIRSIQQVNCQA